MNNSYPVGELPKRLENEVREVLAYRERQMILQATARLRAAGRQGGEAVRLDDGISGGETTMRIDQDSYHYWGQRLGYDCWKDKTFCAEYLRDNEYARVRSVGRKTRVGYEAARAFVQRRGVVEVTGGGKRFSKSYG